MSNTIGGFSGQMMMSAMGGSQRPDVSKVAADIVSQYDTGADGSLDATELQAALDEASSSGTGSLASTDEIMAAFDTDGDSQISEDELASQLQTLAESMDYSQAMGAGGPGPGGMQGMGGMPPPPPPSGGDAESSEEDTGYTLDELTSQLADLTSSDRLSEGDQSRVDLITNIVNDFETADGNGDGRIDRGEAMAYDQSTQSASSSTDSSAVASASSDTDTSASARLMRTVMQLAQSYGSTSQAADQFASSVLSASA